MDSYTIIKKPLITEKCTFIKEKGNYYCFNVQKDATKTEIKKAIEDIFKVHVIEIKTVTMPGKSKRFGRFQSKSERFKKAYVKIKKDEKIDIIEGV
jgi:large subunit ribosomal protein L23